MMGEVRIATRRSVLALAQAKRVGDLLARLHPDTTVRLVEIVTEGDRDTTGDITSLTETGAFVGSLQEAVLDGRADLAVHSLKDLPVSGPDGLVIAAFPERVSPFDVLVGKSLEQLGVEATVGTGSPRRAAQLREMRPDLHTVGLRGNVDTRLRKISAGEVDGAVLAEAGLERLGLSVHIAQRFSVGEMVPAAGQGALAVETQANTRAAELAATLDDPPLRTLLTAERDVLARTGAGCRAALGALATWEGDEIRMDLFVEDENGPRTATVSSGDPETVVFAGCRELGL